jgi:hypothetical protein
MRAAAASLERPGRGRVAVAGLRPPRRRCPAASPRPCSPKLKADSADWAAQLRTVARDYRQLALAHPHGVPLLVTRPLATPLALRPLGTLRPLDDVPTC